MYLYSPSIKAYALMPSAYASALGKRFSFSQAFKPFWLVLSNTCVFISSIILLHWLIFIFLDSVSCTESVCAEGQEINYVKYVSYKAILLFGVEFFGVNAKGRKNPHTKFWRLQAAAFQTSLQILPD